MNAPLRSAPRPVTETRSTAYWRAVCLELRRMGARPASLPECDVLRAAGYAPVQAANVLS